MAFHKIELTDEEILQRLVDGHSFRQMAFDWGVSGKTLWNRLDRLKRVCHARNLYHLIALVVADRRIVPQDVRGKSA